MLRAKILTPSVEASLRPVAGIPGVPHVQAAEVLVVDCEVAERHLCVNVYPAVLTDEARRALTQQLRAADPLLCVCVLIGDSEGEARLFRAPGQPGTAVGSAAAFACYKALWGWDESEHIRILVNGHVARLRLGRWDPDGWLPCFLVASDLAAR